MLLIIDDLKSYIVKDDIAETVDYGYQTSLEFISKFKDEKIDIVLEGTYLTDSFNNIKYKPLNKKLGFITGKSSRILADMELKRSDLVGEYDFDLMIRKKEKKLTYSFIYYRSNTIQVIKQQILQSNCILNKIISKEECIANTIIKSYAEDVFKIIFYINDDHYRILYIEDRTIISIQDYPIDLYDMESIEQDIRSIVRTQEFGQWLDSEIYFIEDGDIIEQMKEGNKQAGGGYGVIYTARKLIFGV